MIIVFRFARTLETCLVIAEVTNWRHLKEQGQEEAQKNKREWKEIGNGPTNFFESGLLETEEQQALLRNRYEAIIR